MKRPLCCQPALADLGGGCNPPPLCLENCSKKVNFLKLCNPVFRNEWWTEVVVRGCTPPPPLSQISRSVYMCIRLWLDRLLIRNDSHDDSLLSLCQNQFAFTGQSVLCVSSMSIKSEEYFFCQNTTLFKNCRIATSHSVLCLELQHRSTWNFHLPGYADLYYCRGNIILIMN